MKAIRLEMGLFNITGGQDALVKIFISNRGRDIVGDRDEPLPGLSLIHISEPTRRS